MHFALVFFLLFGCGKTPSPTEVPKIQVRLILPSALSQNTPLLQKFKQRVRHFEIKARTGEGWAKEWNLTPLDFDKILLDEIPFPATSKDWLEVRVRVWDTKKDGMPRDFSALNAQTRVESREASSEGTVVVPIKLQMKVTVQEYD